MCNQPISIYKRDEQVKWRCNKSKYGCLNEKKSNKVLPKNHKSTNETLNLEVVYRQQNKNCTLYSYQEKALQDH